ncbi:calcium-translocating P-type ATPase, PMCA-type [Falsiporphyromonas endometrii]|uniref:P-type Ca(2+) transporter n=1 Tax=Falsiporphyromonas endometrii TaxID=1387297 RepID=A0ABV9K818_9PORP
MHKHRYVGLDSDAVLKSRKEFGNNILTIKKRDSIWLKLFAKFADPLIIVLLIAALLSALISCYEYWHLHSSVSIFIEPLGILFAVLLATGLSFLFELKAEKEFDILNQVNDDEAYEVIREGSVQQVPKKDIVVGDIVIIEAGCEIPADGVLLESVHLIVDESSLTGESSCRKTVDHAQFDKNATYASNMVFRGTKVLVGHAIYTVQTVGDATENGKVFESTQIDNSTKTPLNEQLFKLSAFITKMSYIIALIIIASRCIRFFTDAGDNWTLIEFVTYFLRSLMLSVTVVVVAVPEGLPMAVTLCLAYSMRRMIKSNNLVRKLHACETMGATNVICTDKTGTLTKNQMEVSSVVFYGLPHEQDLNDSEFSFYVKEGVSVNCTAQLDFSGDTPRPLGNPTESALLLWLFKHGVYYIDYRNDAKVINEIPFSTEYKFMAVEVLSGCGKRILYVKGAPEIIYGMCSHYPNGLDWSSFDAKIKSFQEDSMRTLAFAYKVLDPHEMAIDQTTIVAKDIHFMGFVAIEDAVREDVKDAVRSCRDAGIDIKIVTGDNPITTRRVAQEIGLWTDEDNDLSMMTGPEFEALSDDELIHRSDSLKVVARAKPQDKKRLVECLMKRGHVVAVTGDGTNDAPALKAAHVGLSMGSGTGVAKEAGDITILDDSFASIRKAVMWGRSLYLNIQRFLLFQLTVNLAACLVVLISSFMGSGTLLNVTQMLWVNLIMDSFAAVAFASIPPQDNLMKQHPRDRKQFIITPKMGTLIGIMGAVFAVSLLSCYAFFLHTDIEPGAFSNIFNYTWRDFSRGEITPYEHSLFFNIFVLLQFWNMLNAKAFLSGGSAFRFKGCKGFLLIWALVLIGQIVIITFGGEVFHVCSLSIEDWVITLILTFPVVAIGELVRIVQKHSL